MEAEPIVLPDNTVLDTSKPPPAFNFPKPDFSPVEDVNEPSTTEKTDSPITKPTFKNALQAKKRLQAFSSNRSGPLPSSPLPKKFKANLAMEEKSEDVPVVKKTPKKGSHDDKAKAVIEEIEELKREELQRSNSMKPRSKSRSRSRSQDKEKFKKVEKKTRNYRKRSPTPEKPKKVVAVVKKLKKYPKNWSEFVEFDSNFDLNRDFEVISPKGNNELLRQIFFESPSLPITQFKMKTANKEEKIVPFEYIRYTRTKPIIPYSVNFVTIKDKFLPRKMILETLPKDVVNSIENLYSNSLKFKLDNNINKCKGRMWYPKIWRDIDNECKLLEKSVGLSFLQTYTGEEEENELVEIEVKPIEEKKVEVEAEVELETSDLLAKDKTEEVESKKKKKAKMSEEVLEEKSEISPEKKKKKKRRKDKKKSEEEKDVESASKKKKRKRDKVKKEKRAKEKKVKNKKAAKEKKKNDKSQIEEEKVEKPNKQEVIEELKKIEEKLAKKREDKIKNEKKVEKEEKHVKEKSRKRKHSEREESTKRAKHDKKKETEHGNSEFKTENTSKKKTDKEKKIDLLDIKLEAKILEKIDNLDKHHEKNKLKEEDVWIRNDYKKSKSFEDVDNKTRRKKSRWSEPAVKKEIIDFLEPINLEEEIKRIDEVLKKHGELTRVDKPKIIEDVKKKVPPFERTPDTEDYHSHWESDDDVTSARHQSAKLNRSWESDEELFDRTYSRNKTTSQSYTNLEIPLNIKKFSRRTKWDEKPASYIDTISEFKLLQEERKSLSEERKKLELEKQKILKLQEEATKVEFEEKKLPLIDEPKEAVRMRSSTPEPEVPVTVKKEKTDVLDFNIDSLNNSLLSNISSNESNYPIAVLENEYEEFIKAVSSESTTPTKKCKEKKSTEESDSSSSSSSSSDSDHKKKRRKKKKKKKKKRECEGLLLGKGNNIFNEFDIPVPGDLPEIVPTPVPVPSPIETVLPLTTPSLLLNTIIEAAEKPVEEKLQESELELTKPFVFSSIILPSKKTPLLDNSSLNLNDDSDSADFTDKFVKKSEGRKDEKEVEEKVKEVETSNVEPVKKTEVEEKKVEEATAAKDEVAEVDVPRQVVSDIEHLHIPLPEMEPKKDKEVVKEVQEIKLPRVEEKEEKAKRSISLEPKLSEKSKERRRSRTRSRERESRRRTPLRRREPTPSRRRYSSPRRRSPLRRRTSPRRRSPSPRRRPSPPRRRRRSPSLSPLPRSRSRKHTPSPRGGARRSSPLNSPLDGFKRSVADSTISDDMLPQPAPDDYSESPTYASKYSERRRRGSVSPPVSPKRIPLDDRINQVLGLEKNEPPPPKAPPEAVAFPAAYGYAAPFAHHYGHYAQFGQFGAQNGPYGAAVFAQPPPSVAKPAPTPTKVVQVGNILQVVPTEEIPQVEDKAPETSQKIVQVGNMLQIVPAVIPPPPPPASKPPVLDQSPPKPVQAPEKQSAEALMKQKVAERKAEREKRRQERERRRKEKEKKRRERERRKQMRLKIKTENMIKRAIQLEAEALACEDLDEEGENAEGPIQWPPVSVVVSNTTPACKGILLGEGASKKRKSVQFADGVRPGEGTSPSGGEELSSPPPQPPRLPKEKRYKKLKAPKKSKKKKIKVKVVKRRAPVAAAASDDEDDEDAGLPPPSPPPGSPPPHLFPSRVKTHAVNNARQYGAVQNGPAAPFPFRAPMPVVIGRPPPPPPPGYMAPPPGAYHPDVSGLSHPQYQGVSSHH